MDDPLSSPSTPPGVGRKRERPARGRDGRDPPGYPGSSALRASTPGLKAVDPSRAPPLRDLQPGSSLSESGSEAPRQGCSVFSPSVEAGRKPRRRPRDRSVGNNPLDPARVSHYQAYHPGSATAGRKDDVPYRAPPLRDVQAGLHSDRDYHFFTVELECVTPGLYRTGRTAIYPRGGGASIPTRGQVHTPRA